MVTVLVTGASGFLGSEIVHQVISAGMSVRATGRHPLPSSLLGIDYHRADILNLESLKAAMDGVTYVIHAAGLAHVFEERWALDATFRAVNEGGTGNVVGAAIAAGVRHIVLISSVSVYGQHTANRCDENEPCRPQGAYAESKWHAEQRAIEISRGTNMDVTILRIATIYGEGDAGNVARLVRAIDRGRFIWIGDGTNQKSLTHRDDAARACVIALQSPIRGINIYNVSAPPCTMREVVEGMAFHLDKRLPKWRIPASAAIFFLRMLSLMTRGRGRWAALCLIVQKWLADDVYDGGKFERVFGFKANVNLLDGLGREVKWYRRQSMDYKP